MQTLYQRRVTLKYEKVKGVFAVWWRGHTRLIIPIHQRVHLKYLVCFLVENLKPCCVLILRFEKEIDFSAGFSTISQQAPIGLVKSLLDSGLELLETQAVPANHFSFDCIYREKEPEAGRPAR
jgi:hypothetical protein